MEMQFVGKATPSEAVAFGIPWRNHLKASKLREFLSSNVWNAYFKFSIVRNPWDRAVSLYHYYKNKLEASAYRHRRPALAVRFAKINTFEEWIMQDMIRNSCADYVADASGQIIIDYVARYESLCEDSQRIFTSIGLPVSATLPHLNRTMHADYRSFYNENTYSVIASRFAADIKTFNYTFDRKN